MQGKASSEGLRVVRVLRVLRVGSWSLKKGPLDGDPLDPF